MVPPKGSYIAAWRPWTLAARIAKGAACGRSVQLRSSERLSLTCSDSGDDLDPGLVHRLEPLNLLLRILVWDGADEEWRLPSLSILLGCRAIMI